MNKPLTQAQVHQLHEAMNLIMLVSVDMDSSATECNACGTKRLTNWSAYQVNQKLTGIHNKLTNLLNDEWYQRKD